MYFRIAPPRSHMDVLCMPTHFAIPAATVLMLAQAAWSQEKSTLTEHFVAGKIRVFYTSEGRAAVPSADANSSSPILETCVAAYHWLSAFTAANSRSHILAARVFDNDRI